MMSTQEQKQEQKQTQVQLISTAQFIITELTRAEGKYSSLFLRHTEDLFLEPFIQYVATPLAEEVFGDHNFYVIDAEEMDRRSTGVGGGRAMLLVRIVEAFIHKPASASVAPEDGAGSLSSVSRGNPMGSSKDATLTIPMKDSTSRPNVGTAALGGQATPPRGANYSGITSIRRYH